MGNKLGEFVKETPLIKLLAFSGVFFPFLLVEAPFFSGIRLFASFLFIFILPGISLCQIFKKELSLESILASILGSLAFWTIIGFIWIKGQFSLEISVLTTINIVFSLSMLLIGAYFWHKKGIDIDAHNFADQPQKTQKNSLGWRAHIKQAIRSNMFLFFVFLVLIGFYASIRIPFVPTEDVWFHMAVCNDFLDDGVLVDYDVYRGNLSYHFMWSIFAAYANVDILVVAKYIGVFQVPFGCLLFYYLLCRFISNRDACLLISFIFSLSSMGTLLNFTQFWPTASTIFFGLVLNVNFFQRLQSQQSQLEKDQAMVPLDLKYCIIQGTIALCIIVSHVTSAIVYITPIIFTLFMISIRSPRFLKEMLFYLGLFVLNVLLNPFGLEAATRVDIGFLLAYKYLIIIAVPVGIVVFIYLERFFHRYTYSLQNPNSGGFNSAENSTFWFDDKIYRKYIIPCLVLIGPVVYYFFNAQSKQYLPSNFYAIMVDTMVSAILISAALVGINIYRQYLLIGKAGFLYLLFIIGLLTSLYLLNVVYTYFFRILNLYVPFIFLGAGLYLFYHASRTFTKPLIRKLLYTGLILFLFNSLIYHAQFQEHVTVSKNNFVETTTEFLVEPNEAVNGGKTMIIGNFYYCYVYVYYIGDAPVIYYQYDSHLIRVDNHTAIDENGHEYNVLQALYEKRDLENLFIIIDDEYQTRGIAVLDGVNHGKMTREEVNQYNNLPYINRVAVAGHGRTIFWVIPA
jgi:hypothetical protein